jgi:hypothetical protein
MGGGAGAEAPAGAPARWSIRLGRSTSSNASSPAAGRRRFELGLEGFAFESATYEKKISATPW